MDDLTRLKLMTDENDAPVVPGTDMQGCGECAAALPAARMYTDEQLTRLLELHGGDVEATAYDVLLRKAEATDIRIAGGTELPDQRAYWLSRARSVRKNGSRPASRADGT